MVLAMMTRPTEARIPDDWDFLPIGSLANLYQPVTISAKQMTASGYPVYGANGVVGFYDKTNHDTWQVTVTCRGSTCGTVNRTVDRCWITGNAMVVNGDGNCKISKSFLYYQLSNQDLSTCITGTGQPQIVRSPLAAFEIAVPRNLKEQEAIVEALSDADAYVESLEQLIAKKRLVKQGAMQELLTGKRRLPGFDKSWVIERMDRVLKFQVGFPFSSVFFNEEGVGIRLIKNRDLKGDDQVYHYSGRYESAYLVHRGDVLIGMDGDFMPCVWNRDSALLNQRVGRLVPAKRLDSTFAFYSLIAPLKQIEKLTSATTVKHLSHGDIADIEMPLPSYDEQHAIAAVLSDMDADIEALEAKIDKARDIKQGMMQTLLTGRIRLL